MHGKIEVDMNVIIQQKIDEALIEGLTSIIMDATDRIIVKEYLKIFSKHGIPVQEALQIVSEQMDILNKYSNDDPKEDTKNV